MNAAAAGSSAAQRARAPTRARRGPRRPPRRASPTGTRLPPGSPRNRAGAQALERRRELEQRVVADARQRAVPGAPVGAHGEPEDALLAERERVEAAPVALERDAAALVDDEVGAHEVGPLLAQPLGAVGRARLLVGGRDDQQLAARRPPAAARPARPRPRPRRRPGPSCRARRGPRPRRRRRRRSTGRGSTPTASAGTVSAWPSRHSVGPSASPRSRATRLGRSGSAPTSSHSKPASASSVAEQLLARALAARAGSRCRCGSAAGAARPPRRRAAIPWRPRPLPSRPGYPRAARGILRRDAGAAFRHRRGQADAAPACPPAEAPLAVRMRPRDLDELLGQEHLLGEGSTLRAAIESGEPHSAIFYGPPGSGKTTLARIVAERRARRLRGGLGGQRRPRRGARGDRARRGAPPRDRRADDLLPRRDPPLQQGPAGRAAARGRGGPGDADRGDDREPLLRGQLGAALALPDLRVPAARRRRTSRS